MTLDILIPQYKETDEVIKPLLDSIALQQQVDQAGHVPDGQTAVSVHVGRNQRQHVAGGGEGARALKRAVAVSERHTDVVRRA